MMGEWVPTSPRLGSFYTLENSFYEVGQREPKRKLRRKLLKTLENSWAAALVQEWARILGLCGSHRRERVYFVVSQWRKDTGVQRYRS